MKPFLPAKKVPFPKKAPVNIFMAKKTPGNPSGRPARPSAAATAKKAKEDHSDQEQPDQEQRDQEPAAPPVASAPVVGSSIYSPHPKESTMTHEQLVAANNDYYEKLAERDAKIEELEAELRAKTTAIEDATTNNANLQKEVKQYTKDVREKSEMLKSSQDNVTKMRTGQSNAFKALEKDYKNTMACFVEAQGTIDRLQSELVAKEEACFALQETVEGAHRDSESLVQQLREYQARENAFQQAKEFTDSIEREFELVFQEMGRDLNAATILSHIHELQSTASRPRRKVDRKVSIAEELENHSDAESIAESIDGSEHGDANHHNLSSRPAAQDNDVDDYDPLAELTDDEIAEAEAHFEADAHSTLPTPQSVSSRARAAATTSRYQPEDSPMSSPIPTFDFEKGFRDATQRYKEAEAALENKTARVEEFEASEKVRVANAHEAARNAAADKIRSIEQDAEEKLRLTNEITRLNKLVTGLSDRIAETPNLKAHNASLLEQAREWRKELTATLKEKDAEHSRRSKAKDDQVAEWQQAINEMQSNSLLIGPLPENPVYRDVVREKTTSEWLRDAPFWWQLLLAMMLLFLCVGNLSVWMERHAWVNSNVFALDHVRTMAKQGIRGPSAAALWFEDFIGFDRTHLG